MIPQLPLVLRWPRRQRFEHFHPGSNVATLTAVEQVAYEPGTPWLYLAGPAGSGKSHLLVAACQAAVQGGRTVQYLPLASMADKAAAIRGVAGSEFLALDDLGAIAGNREAEHALFDVYNRAKAEGAALLFAAEALPSQLGLGLPDLRSRLGACQQGLLKPLDDAERRAVLRQEATTRGIELDDTVLDWLFTRYKRDLGALLDLLDRLDQASLAAKRRITVPFLREFLRDTDPGA
ncbi:regulatory inactivation of DnaA Hda protein [Dyella jiangningensis]|uniref:DnaA regulatory inactivator Hda n=1 Tax=Dyella sp. AtDHG13 TaxID=1938897 RepID=UPI000885BEA0|nr:DnaA regulatory inactivator Hda [Dyella sp. AtDHG13]PXV54646.1 regulatory inactivation of DnaA Hda protein [Dyella sp. AtDHG13]SDK89859.1 regulatory inactivation of DnaA Hda protein [Dyella jiangningensis]